jgi:AAHS family 4-hydroxybenzoate transporter-like MFS transporter
MNGENKETINITRTIDARPFTAFQIGAIALCALVAFLDGIDSQSIAIAAPLIAEKLGLVRTALGPLFSAAVLGATIGALTFGPLGDHFGRKRCLIAATVIFGIFTLLTAYVASYQMMLIVRFAAGIGLGGATPCFIALASEYAPQRRRAMIASLIWAGFPLGGMVGGFANSYILVSFGWPAIFLVGGILPLAIAAILSLWLPESIRFLLAKGGSGDTVRAIVRRILPEAGPKALIVADEEHISGIRVKYLFSEGRAVGTLFLWVPFMMAFGTLLVVVVWTPALLRINGIAPSQGAVVLGFHGLGALIGMASAGRLMERFGTVATLVPAFILGRDRAGRRVRRYGRVGVDCARGVNLSDGHPLNRRRLGDGNGPLWSSHRAADNKLDAGSGLEHRADISRDRGGSLHRGCVHPAAQAPRRSRRCRDRGRCEPKSNPNRSVSVIRPPCASWRPPA